MKEKELERIFKALANRRRLSILKYLKKNKDAPVGEISEHIRLSMKATSKHLSVLAAADILNREQRGSLGFYWLVGDMPKFVLDIINNL